MQTATVAKSEAAGPQAGDAATSSLFDSVGKLLG